MAQPIESMVVEASGPITVSSSAAQQVARLLSTEEDSLQALRVTVSGGGCSGFQYGFAFDAKRQDDDIVIEQDGVTVTVPDKPGLGITVSEQDLRAQQIKVG